MLNKLKIIIFSRFKKPKIEPWIQKRRDLCKKCKWNTLNQVRLPIKVRFIKWLSDLYSWITGNSKNDNLGNCTACEICSIYYKTAEKVEYCEKEKWDTEI